MLLGDLLPERAFAGGQEGVLASVPAEEVRGAGMGGVVFAGRPNFVEQECPGVIGAAMQVVPQAAFLSTRGTNEGAELGFEEQVLPLLGAQRDDEREGTLR